MKQSPITNQSHNQDRENTIFSLGTIIGAAIAFVLGVLCYLADISLKI